MRLWCAPLIRERSGDLCGMGLVVYELIGMLSRAFSSNALAACAMTDEVPARVVRIGEPGFKGRGGGSPFRWRTLCMIVVQVRRNELRNAGSKPGWMSLCSETE
jgi:hypothetical protein